MKLLLQQIKHLKETEVKISYSEKDETANQIIQYVLHFDQKVEAFQDEKQYRIPVSQLLYIEATDHKTFLYTVNEVYESRKNVHTLETELIHTAFFRIGKGLLLNLDYMKTVQPYPNHRLLVELKNEEHLIVSRKYISGLKERLKRG